MDGGAARGGKRALSCRHCLAVAVFHPRETHRRSETLRPTRITMTTSTIMTTIMIRMMLTMPTRRQARWQHGGAQQPPPPLPRPWRRRLPRPTPLARTTTMVGL